MNRQPDKLFRDKLYSYEKTVSAQAWKRVSGEVRKSDNGRVWLKIAAAILVLAVAGVFLFSIGFNDDEKLVTKTDPVEKQKSVASGESAQEKIAIAKDERKDDEEKAAKQQTVTQRKAEQKREPRPAKISLTALIELEKTEVAKDIPPMHDISELEFQAAHIESLPVMNEPETSAKSVTIVFSAKEVNEKYLAKKESPDATSQEKESSTLKKVLGKAYDLTHNQDPMGDLRQKKNEILAMNFKNDKQRNEND